MGAPDRDRAMERLIQVALGLDQKMRLGVFERDNDLIYAAALFRSSIGEPRPCDHCGQKTERKGDNGWQRYCSPECRVAHRDSMSGK